MEFCKVNLGFHGEKVYNRAWRNGNERILSACLNILNHVLKAPLLISGSMGCPQQAKDQSRIIQASPLQNDGQQMGLGP